MLGDVLEEPGRPAGSRRPDAATSWRSTTSAPGRAGRRCSTWPRRRRRPGCWPGRGMALVFEKPSTRTRHSMEMAVVQLGGHPVYVQGAEVGIDQRESVEDVARTLACYHAAIGARVFAHRHRRADGGRLSPVPVVNLLSDQAHPMQALADLLTDPPGGRGRPGRDARWPGWATPTTCAARSAWGPPCRG